MQNKRYNCPNCGAPIGYAEKCAYCGTLLNWIPTKEVRFVPEQMQRTILEARVAVDYGSLIGVGIKEEQIKDELKRQLAEAIPEAWEVCTMEDYRQDSVVYRARLYVWRRNG